MPSEKFMTDMLSKLLIEYKRMLNLKDSKHRGNLKFVEYYIKRNKSKLFDCLWFVEEAIDLHYKTLGRVR